MALEDRSSPNNASSPGPNTANHKPGLNGSAVTSNKVEDKKPNIDINVIKQECEDVKIWKQISAQDNVNSYSITRFVNSSSHEDKKNYEQINEDKTSKNEDSRIKFSVDNILKPDFGASSRNNRIWNPLKRTITPIIRASDELRKPRVNNRSRNLEVNRVTEVNECDLVSVKTRRLTCDSLSDSTKQPLSSPAPSTSSEGDQSSTGKGNELWPAWVYCTRYSDRPSSGMSILTLTKQTIVFIFSTDGQNTLMFYFLSGLFESFLKLGLKNLLYIEF